MYGSDSDETYPSSEEEEVTNDEDVETIKILGQTLNLPCKVCAHSKYVNFNFLISFLVTLEALRRERCFHGNVFMGKYQKSTNGRQRKT